MLEAPREPASELLISVEPLPDTTETMVALREVRAKVRRFRRDRRVRAAAVVASVLLVAAVGGLTAFLIGNEVVYASTRVRAGNLAVVVRAGGVLTAPTYTVDSTVAGTLGSLDVAVGDQVTAGQTLAQVNAPLLDDAVAQAQAAVSSAQTSVADTVALQSATQADTDAADTAAWHQEQAALYACDHPVGSPPPNCEDAAIAQYNAALAHSAAQVALAQSSVDTAQTQLTLANAALQAAQDNLAAATLIAPHAGTITAISGYVGAPVGPGASGVYASAGPLITIVDLAALQVRTQVPQGQEGQVQAGQAVAFTAAAYPKHVFRGTVSEVAPVASANAEGISFPVTVDVDMVSGQEASSTLNVPVEVTIYLAQRYNVLLVPATSVTYAHKVLAGTRTSRKGATARPGAPSAAAVQQAWAGAALLASQALAGGASEGTDTPTADVLVSRGPHGWILMPVLLGLSDGQHVVVLAGLIAGEVVATGEDPLVGAPAAGANTAGGSSNAGDPPRLFGS